MPFDFQPTLEDSNAQRIMAIGSIDDVVDAIGFYRDLLGLEHLCFFFDLPGLTRDEIDEQLHLVAEEVFPRLGETMARPAPAGAPLMLLQGATLADGTRADVRIEGELIAAVGAPAGRRAAARTCAISSGHVLLRRRRRAPRPPRQGADSPIGCRTRPAT